MRPLKALLFLILALAAGTALYFLDADRDEGPADPAPKPSQARPADPLAIGKIVLSGKQHPQAVYIKRLVRKHCWQITQPVNWPADSTAVGNLISRVLEAAPEPGPGPEAAPAQVGLEPPLVKYALKDRKGVEYSLSIGDESPTGKYIYAEFSGSRGIKLLKIKERGGFQESLFTLRDKSVLYFVAMDVNRVDISAPRGGINLRKAASSEPGKEMTWFFADSAQASTDLADELVFALHGLRVERFIDNPGPASDYGLDRPRGRIELFLADGESQGISIGARDPKTGHVFVQRLSGGPVMLTDLKVLKLLALKKWDLKDRRILRISRHDITGIRVKTSSGTIAFSQKNRTWIRTVPPGDEKNGQIGALLAWELENLKWKFIFSSDKKTGIAKPSAEIEILTGEKAPLLLKVGGLNKERNLLAVALAGGKKVYGVDPKFIKSIPRPGE